MNHFVKACKKPKKKPVHDVAQSDSELEDADVGELFLGALFFDELDQNNICIDYKFETISLNDLSIDDSNDYLKEIFIDEVHALNTKERNNELLSNLEVNGDSILFKVDTGAQCNVLSEGVHSKLSKKSPIVPMKTKLTTYGGTHVPLKGKCRLDVCCGTNKISAEFYIAQIKGAKPLLGLKSCRDLQVITVNELLSSNDQLAEEYKDVFTGLGLVDGEYHITLEENVQPKIHSPRNIRRSIII